METEETRILIDAGLSGRQIRKRLASIGRAPENLTGIVITHEHSDHIQGLALLAQKLNIPVYCNRDTADALQRQFATRFNCRDVRGASVATTIMHEPSASEMIPL